MKCFHFTFRVACLTIIFLAPLSADWNARAQCVIDSLSLPDSVCENEAFVAQLHYSNGTNPVFDLCNDAFTAVDTIESYTSIYSQLNSPRSISLAEDSAGNWFGFIKDFSMANIVRLQFGSSLNNVPTAAAMTVNSSVSISAGTRGGIKFANLNGNWFGVSPMINSRMVIIPFGNDLAADSLDAIVHFSATLFPSPAAVDFTMIEDSLHLVVLNQNGVLSTVNFGPNNFDTIYSSFSNNLLFSSGHISNGRAVEVINDCGDLHVYASGIVKQRLAHLGFGTSFSNTPSVKLMRTGVTSPAEMRSTITADGYKIWVKNNHSSLGLTAYSLGAGLDTILDQTQFFDTPGALRGLGFEMVYRNGRYEAMVLNTSPIAMNRVTFSGGCQPGQGVFETDSLPLSFSSEGVQKIVARLNINNEMLGVVDSVRVLTGPGVQFSWSGVCLDDSTRFIDSSMSTPPIQSWLWNFDDGSPNSSAQHPTHLYNDTGSYDVILEVTNTNGCNAIDTNTVNIFSLPVADFTYSIPCLGKEVVLTDQSTAANDSLVYRRWVVDSTDTLFGTPAESVFDSLGQYTVSLLSISSNGCRDSLLDTVTVLPAPVASISASNTCFGDTVDFSNTTFSPITFSDVWYFGDGDSSLSFEPSHPYLDTGSYAITYIAIANNQCSDTLMDSIRISQATFAGIGLPSTNICTGESNLLLDLTDYLGETRSSTRWIVGMDTTYEQNASVQFSNDTTQLPVSFRSTLGTSCIVDTSFTIDVLVGVTPDFSLGSNCLGDTAVFSEASLIPLNQSIATTSWQFGDGSPSESGQIVEHVYADSGFYTVNYALETDSGCSGEVSQTIRIYNSVLSAFTLTGLRCTGNDLEAITTIITDPLDSVFTSEWQLLGGSLDSTFDVSDPVILESPGSYSVILSGLTENGCSYSTTRTVTVVASPNATYTFDTACAQAATKFNDLYSGSNYARTWTFEGLSTSFEDDPEVFFPFAGTFESSLELTDLVSGCSDTFSLPVAVASIDSIHLTANGLCKGTEVTFDAESFFTFDALDRVDWILNNVTGFSGTSVTLNTADEAEEVTAIATVISNAGCRSSAMATWSLIEAPEFTLDTVHGANILDINFEVTSSDSIGAIRVETNDGQVADTAAGLLSFSEAGIYRMTVDVTFANGCATSRTFTLPVGLPTAVLNISEFTIRSIGGGFLEFDAIIENTGNRPTENFTLEVTAEDGAQFRQTIDATIDPFGRWTGTLSGTLERNNNRFYCLRIIAIDEEDLIDPEPTCVPINDDNLVSAIWPNPTEDEFSMIVFNTAESDLIVEIYDAQGALVLLQESVLSRNQPPTTLTFDVQSLRNGMYIVMTKVGEDVFIRRLIKQ